MINFNLRLKTLFKPEIQRHHALAEARIIPDAARCVQCGICSFNCPIQIDVRRHAWTGTPVEDSHCLSCGECVCRCPRGALRMEKNSLVALDW
jgi:Pyruvate/2-oxoacid:ferredoxin oxidoreductase delta subunit